MPVVSFKTHIGSSERQKIAEKRLKDDLRVYANMDKKAVSQVMKSMKGKDLASISRDEITNIAKSYKQSPNGQVPAIAASIKDPKTPGPRSGSRMSGGGGHHSNEQPRDEKGMWT